MGFVCCVAAQHRRPLNTPHHTSLRLLCNKKLRLVPKIEHAKWCCLDFRRGPPRASVLNKKSTGRWVKCMFITRESGSQHPPQKTGETGRFSADRWANSLRRQTYTCLGKSASRSPLGREALPCFILAIRRIHRNIRFGLYNVKLVWKPPMRQ
jgi:hypothetical protein